MNSLRDVFGPISEGKASESIDNCIRLHLDHYNQFPIIEIYSRLDNNGNAIDSDDILEKIGVAIRIKWNSNQIPLDVSEPIRGLTDMPDIGCFR